MKFKNKPNQSWIVSDQGEIAKKDIAPKPKLVWESRSVAINCILIAYNDGNPYVLCSKRGPKSADFQGLWNLVAGYLDWDETGTEAAIRETWEEVGLNLSELELKYPLVYDHLNHPWFVNTSPKENRQNVSLRYGLVIDIGSDDLPELTTKYNEVEGEVEDPSWIRFCDVKKYNWAFNHDKTIRQFGMLVDIY